MIWYAWIMDYLVRPFYWLFSPNFRSHMRVVEAQNAYLRRTDDSDKDRLRMKWKEEANRDAKRRQ